MIMEMTLMQSKHQISQLEYIVGDSFDVERLENMASKCMRKSSQQLMLLTLMHGLQSCSIGYVDIGGVTKGLLSWNEIYLEFYFLSM